MKYTIDDCRCEIQRSWDRPNKWDMLQYNPRCQFHKGPDKGYGYDRWGQPNGKHSEKIGTIGAAVVVGSLLVTIIFLVAMALGAFG